MIIDGTHIASMIRRDLSARVALNPIKPHLTFILVGENPASLIYVKMKKRACKEVGITSEVIELPPNIATEELVNVIEQCNINPSVHGILVQLPLPKHINTSLIINSIDPKKDVDGFHPINFGKLLADDNPNFVPCTPLGIQKLLAVSHIPIEGKHVVIVGRSNIVGKPLAALLMQNAPYANATVSVANSKTSKLKELCLSADIIVSAVGHPNTIRGDMVSKGATVIDVGINRVDGRLQGDVDFIEVEKKASYITPVPGGVGPMTIAMLLQNTLSAYDLQQ